MLTIPLHFCGTQIVCEVWEDNGRCGCGSESDLFRQRAAGDGDCGGAAGCGGILNFVRFDR